MPLYKDPAFVRSVPETHATHDAYRQSLIKSYNAAFFPALEMRAIEVGIAATASSKKHPFINNGNYRMVEIQDVGLSNKLSFLFAASADINIRRAADYPLRPHVWAAPFDTLSTPLVVRHNSFPVEQLFDLQSSPLHKAILIHSRGQLNTTPCAACTPGQTGVGHYPYFLGCISLSGFYDGACSNCVYSSRQCGCPKIANTWARYDWRQKQANTNNPLHYEKTAVSPSTGRIVRTKS